MKKLLLTIILLIILDCSGEKTYPVRGTIIEVRKETNDFLIHHDEISGFMMAMTMPFKLADSLDINRYGVGDSLKFRLEMKEEKAFANNFQLLGKGTLPETDNIWDDEYTPLDIGEIFDDATFLDLDSQNVSLSDNDSIFRFISYIFTRCPMPNMCPAVVIKNNYLAESFSDHENIDFIMVSFDYIYDTPSVLKDFYGSTILGHNNWKVWSSIGRIDDVYRLVRQSGGDFWGIEEGSIGHTLSSVLIGPDRVDLGLWQGDKWQSGQVKKAIDLLMQK